MPRGRTAKGSRSPLREDRSAPPTFLLPPSVVVPDASSVCPEEKMTTFSRRRFTALAGLATIGAAVPLRYAKAAEFSFKLSTNVPETHPLNVYARKAAEELAQTTDGRFELKIFPNNQLGGDTDMFSQLRSA